jgi:hypothetical protein
LQVGGPFSCDSFQIWLGYKYLRGADLPGNLPFDKAATDLIQDYGRLRVQAILTAIPNDPKTTNSDALAAARYADTGEQRHE